MLNSHQERRRTQRGALDVPLTVRLSEGPIVETEAIAINASPDGFLLQIDRELPPGSRIEVLFVFPPSRLDSRGVRVVFHCKVVRVEGGASEEWFGIAAVVVRTESGPVAAVVLRKSTGGFESSTHQKTKAG